MSSLCDNPKHHLGCDCLQTARLLAGTSKSFSAAESGELETPDDFIEQILYPAFNVNPLIAQVDPVFGGAGNANEVLEIVLTDGSQWQVTIAKRRG